MAIFATARRDRLYIMTTRELSRAVFAVKTGHGAPYARMHAIDRLVHVERYGCRHTAKLRTARLRAWPFAERAALVRTANPAWSDLSEEPSAQRIRADASLEV
ncbi:hypothetical protein [Parvularcula dongshanensis]|uniref:Putative GIY-YIG superfamily endonuclease n=1 Tax=Parvularcula dongshanensis TaxID=1173995 RepID=A0A840I3C9_9PROT|nr:hypothetical protein [Parvularcula dongshanensis]MBB4658688.1 putative GIY-YIG superfamily endonuclease [Parvularcula dongshanensis]